MPKLPDISQREAVRKFRKIGYAVERQGKHIIMSKGDSTLIIPRHNPIDPYTMGAIAKDAGLTPEEFKKL